MTELPQDTFWVPRAQFIRELLAAHPRIKNKTIKALCVAAGHEEPKRQAIQSVRNRPNASAAPVRPSYYTLWKEYIATRDNALAKGFALAETARMKEILVLAEHCIMQDKLREPLTARRVRKKRKPKPKPKPSP